MPQEAAGGGESAAEPREAGGAGGGARRGRAKALRRKAPGCGAAVCRAWAHSARLWRGEVPR